jgi:hypothetical protein
LQYISISAIAIELPGPIDLRPATSSSWFVLRKIRASNATADLYRLETIDVVDSVLGTSIDVPTLSGQVSVKVPAGTQPDPMLPLRGKGLPSSGGARRAIFSSASRFIFRKG